MSSHIRQRFGKSSGASESSGLNGASLLSLSLYLILLAFFIVLNAISHYADPKVDGVFESLDLTFATRLEETTFEQDSADERIDSGKGQGESLEDMQEMLKSILPGLNINLTDDPNGGKTMMIRMEKNKFDRLSPQLIPVFARILNAKDRAESFAITMTSYVRDTLSSRSVLSYKTIEGYKTRLIQSNISSDRINVQLTQGNPAFMVFQFNARGQGYEQ